MKTAGIRELKAQLSRYIRQVEDGETVLVTDRGKVIAELRPPGTPTHSSPRDQRYWRLVEQGTIRPAESPTEREWRKWPGLGLPTGYSREFLDADRGE